jgi:hypothetical protein
MGTGISTMVWCGCGGRGSGIVCGEVGGFSGSDFWGVVYGQGCRMRVWAWNPAVGVPGILRAAAYRADSHQAEKCDLESVNADLNKTLIYYKVEVRVIKVPSVNIFSGLGEGHLVSGKRRNLPRRQHDHTYSGTFPEQEFQPET